MLMTPESLEIYFINVFKAYNDDGTSLIAILSAYSCFRVSRFPSSSGTL